MNKITIPFFADILTYFHTSKYELPILLACLARNGEEEGCCSDEIISNRTGLSSDIIQQTFKSLIEKGQFIPTKGSDRRRCGKVNINNNFKKKYWPDLFIKKNDFRDTFFGKIEEIQIASERLFLISPTGQKYVVFLTNPHSVILHLPLGLFISFKGHLIENNKEIIYVWMDEKTIECKDFNAQK